MRSFAVLVPLMMAIAACSSAGADGTFDSEGKSTANGNGNDDEGGGFEDTDGKSNPQNGATGACGKMDILFVIDNSGSMKEEQDNLAENFPKFIETINDFKSGDGKNLDYRIAVTTTSRDVTVGNPGGGLFGGGGEQVTGDNGAFRHPRTCKMQRGWLERSDANLENTFSCVAKVGIDGSGLEMPLDVMKLALSDRVKDGTNAGFLRDDALLAIVMLTDENDCSLQGSKVSKGSDKEICANNPLTKVGDYVSFLDGLKKAHGRWATAVIAGERDCSSKFGQADAASRLQDFVTATGKTGKFSSICQGDLNQSLKDALNTFDVACKEFPQIK
jgi:hypothetical protein